MTLLVGKEELWVFMSGFKLSINKFQIRSSVALALDEAIICHVLFVSLSLPIIIIKTFFVPPLFSSLGGAVAVTAICHLPPP